MGAAQHATGTRMTRALFLYFGEHREGVIRVPGGAVWAWVGLPLEGGIGRARERIDGTGQAFEHDPTNRDSPLHDRLRVQLLVDIEGAAGWRRHLLGRQEHGLEWLLDRRGDRRQRDN